MRCKYAWAGTPIIAVYAYPCGLLMKLLAFDTSTEQLSVAVQHGDHIVAHTGTGGPQASAKLIPIVLDLLARAGLTSGELDAIVFGRGPGSFTGLRTACSVAQGLAYGAGQGAGVPVLPVDTLMAVAEAARLQTGAGRVLALLDARMGEVYRAAYAWQSDVGCDAGHEAGSWATALETMVCKPEELSLPAGDGWVLAGNAAAVYGERFPQALGAAPYTEALPTAEALLSLAPPLLAAGRAVPPAQALPLYIRDKVAQTTAERAALAR